MKAQGGGGPVDNREFNYLCECGAEYKRPVNTRKLILIGSVPTDLSFEEPPDEVIQDAVAYLRRTHN